MGADGQGGGGRRAVDGLHRRLWRADRFGGVSKSLPKNQSYQRHRLGTQLAPRIVAERRGEKYLADVYSGGGTSLYQNLYLGKMLDPIKPALILPEVIDPTKWWEGKHKYVDREGR